MASTKHEFEESGLRKPPRRRSGRWTLLLLSGLILASALVSERASAQENVRYSSKRLQPPRSVLNQPYDDHVFLGAYGQMGWAFDYDVGELGGGAIIMFRPGRAASFLNFLYDWNSSLVLQADYQNVTEGARILSGDLIIRRYVQDMRLPDTRLSPFIGAGVGGSEITRAPGSGPGKDQYWSWLLEAGQEWNWRGGHLLFVKLQYRHYSFSGLDYSNVTVQAGAGIPLPW